MKPARILVLFGNVPLYGNERINIETLDQLQQRGAEALFLIRPDWTEQAIQPELRRRGLAFCCVPYFDAVRRGVGWRTWWRNLVGILGGSWALLCEIRRFRATHLHVGTTSWVLNFLPALMLCRLPLVFRAGDVPALHHPLWRWVWRYTRRRAAVFVCDSAFVRDRLLALGAPAARCTVIYAPAPSRALPQETGGPPPTSLERASVPTFLYVGQISADKGVDLLVEAAMAILARYDGRFLIAGDYAWRNPLGAALVARVAELGLADRISFLGFVEAIEPLYAAAQVHLAPSVCDEAYGLTVLEAKARGLPSIVFPSGGLVELVQHGREGWVCPEKTAAALVTAMEHYLRYPADIVTQGAAGRASLTVRLHVDEYGQRWGAVYDALT